MVKCRHCNGTGVCRQGKLESNCCECFGVKEKLPKFKEMTPVEYQYIVLEDRRG